MSDRPDIHTHAAQGLSAPDQKRYDDTLHCNRCGLCTSACPTYLATGNEGLSPRGRNQIFRAVLEGRLGDPRDAEGSFDTCLQCGICTSVCFAEVPTAKLMGAARGKVAQVHGAPLLQRFFLRFLLARPKLLEWTLLPFFLVKRSGVSRFLNRLGLLKLVNPSLAAAEELVDRVPLRFPRRRPPPADADVVQFVACGTHYLMPEAETATTRLLDKLGCRHGRADTVCCGLPGISTGDWDSARSLARRNIAALEKFSKAVVLADDSSCAATLKDYPSLFEDDPAWFLRAKAVSARVKDLSEWIVERGESGFPSASKAGEPAHAELVEA